MGATREGRTARAASGVPADLRAGIYLDLWERQVSAKALGTPQPAPMAGGCNIARAERQTAAANADGGLQPVGNPDRTGQPSPLIFHLGAALSIYGQAIMAAPRADSPSFPWQPELAAAARRLGSDLDPIEVAEEVAARLRATIRGIEAWQRHPYRRDLAEPPVVWRNGCSRLLDYGQVPEATAPDGLPVLVVPSLINRGYILDLMEGRSVLRALAAAGLRPFALDWGEPGPVEAGFGLGDYGSERLLPALAEVRARTGRDVAVLGYCMGATLAVGMAARAPEGISALATLGAPWDFASARGIAGGLRAMLRAEGSARTEALLRAAGEAFGLVPVSLFQTLFALVNPVQATVKFQKFARMDPRSEPARLFVALEDWLADGVPMPAPAAIDLLVHWQIGNVTAWRQWQFLGGMVDPGRIRIPTLVLAGQKDSIAPPPLSEPLARAIPGARLLRPRTGHVGMVVGEAAGAEVVQPLVDFLHAHAGG